MIFFHKLFYPALFFTALLVFLLHYVITGQAVYGDGIGYYAHLRSWVIDQSIDTTNEYKHNYSPENNNSSHPTSSKQVQLMEVNEKGMAENYYGTGVAVLLFPFFILADFFTLIASFLGFHLPRNGYANTYQIFSGIGAISYVILGLILLDELLQFWTKNKVISKLTILTIYFGTQLLYYASFDVLNSHFASFFLTTLFFSIYFLKEESIMKNFLLGSVVGLAVSTRPQDGTVLIIWIITLFPHKYYNLSNTLQTLSSKILVFFLGFFIALIPFITNWIIAFGSFTNYYYVRIILGRINDKKEVDLFGSLFDPTNGLFFKAPLLLILCLFFFYLIKNKKTGRYWPLLVFFITQIIIVTLQAGWIAASYGGRMYISSLVFFSLLLGEFYLFLQKKYSYKVVVITSLSFILLNIFFMGKFILFEKGTSSGNGGTEPLTQQRIEKLLNLFR